jgi:bifunctional non-homologous end joining protein LigD
MTATRGRSAGAATLADDVVRQLEEIEADGGDGELRVGRGKALHVSSLDKMFFPKARLTKGGLMRYYAMVSPTLLPIIDGRPMIMKRYPDGVGGSSFFQQNPGERTPAIVRTATVTTETGDRAERIIGGDLPTLLYLVQIGTIAIHAWQARARTPRYADTTTIDLDPGDDVPFSAVVTLAKEIKVQLDKLQLKGAIKTSGSSGLHIVLPLPPKTAFEEAAQLAERIAERVVEANPDRATLERSVKARPKRSIYVDAQQNAAGKSVVAAYSVRERPEATVSAPLEWRELRGTLRLEAFTTRTMPARLRRRGDLWGAAMNDRNSRRAIDLVLGKSQRRRRA